MKIVEHIKNALRTSFNNAAQSQIPLRDATPGSQLYEAMVDGVKTAGVVVNERTAKCVTAVYSCVNLIGGSIGCLPIKQFRTINGKETEYHDDISYLLNVSPHKDWTAMQFWMFIMESRLLKGDGFAEIIRAKNAMGISTERIIGFRPINPTDVSVRLREDGVLVYWCWVYLGGENECWERREIEAPDMLHFTGPGFDGIRSPSQISYVLRNPVGTAYAADQYSSHFFSNGSRPDFALEHPGEPTDEQVQELRRTWAERHQGPYQSHLPALLTGGMQIKEISVNSEDSQLLETRKFQVEDVARVFGVPPHMIGHMDGSPKYGSGIEQQSIGYSKFTLQPHLTLIKQELRRKIFKQRNHRFEFDTNELERGDAKSRNESSRMAIGRAGEPGWKTINEVRASENLPPIEGGDELNTLQGPVNEPTRETTD